MGMHCYLYKHRLAAMGSSDSRPAIEKIFKLQNLAFNADVFGTLIRCYNGDINDCGSRAPVNSPSQRNALPKEAARNPRRIPNPGLFCLIARAWSLVDGFWLSRPWCQGMAYGGGFEYCFLLCTTDWIRRSVWHSDWWNDKWRE